MAAHIMDVAERVDVDDVDVRRSHQDVLKQARKPVHVDAAMSSTPQSLAKARGRTCARAQRRGSTR